MGRERLQTRADSDTVEQVQDYQEDRDISDSEAVRRLLRRGLQAEGYRPTAISSEADAPADSTAKYDTGDSDRRGVLQQRAGLFDALNTVLLSGLIAYLVLGGGL